jgi:hypothetical protein
MIAMAGAAARKVWAAQKPAAKDMPSAGSSTGDEDEDEGDDESADSTPAPTGAVSNPTTQRRADHVTEPPSRRVESPSSLRPAQVNHFQQIGISMMPGTGYRLLVPYQENIHCGDHTGNVGNRVCSHMLPFFLDLQLAYGIHPRAELIVDLRFGLQKDPVPGGGHQFALAPGVRYWLDQGVALKFYATGQIVYDHTDYVEVSKNDIAIRNADGLMYDVIKNVGFFFQLGWTMGFARWYRIEFDSGLGVQVRFP